jgi:PQQ-dependent catabolism-associated CXXCW motif protein
MRWCFSLRPDEGKHRLLEGSTAKQIMIRRVAGFILFGALALGGAYAQEHAAVEPEAYRTDDYRAPTPKTLRGARMVSTVEAETLWRTGTATFVDVMPYVPRPANLPAGTLWRDKPRLNIPGSVWLPDTGYGELAAVMENYLRAGLERVTGGDRAKLLVIYCQRDCWMSWNAAKRAVAWGYSGVIWYPEGTDGWQDAGLPLEQGTPKPRPGE